MVRKEKKRGPKYPEGVMKRKILLIALNYPDGISEVKLIDKIKEKLPITNNRGIKGHLDDLGPGRTVEKVWKNGKQHLIKIPSKFEPKKMKIKLMDVLKTQKEERDINDLPEENFWKPNMNDIKIFEEISREMLKYREESISFVNSEYAQRWIRSLNQYELNIFEQPELKAFFEKGIKLSPTFLQYLVFLTPEVEVGVDILLSVLEAYSEIGHVSIKQEVSIEGMVKRKISHPPVILAPALYLSLVIDTLKYPVLTADILKLFQDPVSEPLFTDYKFPKPTIENMEDLNGSSVKQRIKFSFPSIHDKSRKG